MRGPQKPQNFEKFYYDYVGKGEACGCAERIIDVHEFNRLAGRPEQVATQRVPLFSAFRRLFRKRA